MHGAAVPRGSRDKFSKVLPFAVATCEQPGGRCQAIQRSNSRHNRSGFRVINHTHAINLANRLAAMRHAAKAAQDALTVGRRDCE